MLYELPVGVPNSDIAEPVSLSTRIKAPKVFSDSPRDAGADQDTAPRQQLVGRSFTLY